MMNPSKPDNTAGGSTNDSETSRLTTPCLSSGPSGPSAPLLPSNHYESSAPDMDPPSYSSVMAQDLNDWKNLTRSSSGHVNLGSYPSASSHMNRTGSISGLGIQTPYPTEPTINAANLAEGISGDKVPENPMPVPVETREPIGFENVVTKEPKSANLGPMAKEHGSTTMPRTGHIYGRNGQKLIQPPFKVSSENSRYIQEREYAQRQPISSSDGIAIWECFLCCCECFKCCIEVAECIAHMNNN